MSASLCLVRIRFFMEVALSRFIPKGIFWSSHYPGCDPALKILPTANDIPYASPQHQCVKDSSPRPLPAHQQMWKGFCQRWPCMRSGRGQNLPINEQFLQMYFRCPEFLWVILWKPPWQGGCSGGSWPDVMISEVVEQPDWWEDWKGSRHLPL